LIGKLIVHGSTREEAIRRLKRSLDEMIISGIETTLPLFQDLLENDDILTGNYHIHWLENWLQDQKG
jgi:acetyl-CoA carboxylase biotin carboxylase subunit